VSLSALNLADFRNYSSLVLGLDSRIIVLTGANGVGKTNLLEAISLLTPGRGLRRASFDEIVRNGTTNSWAVSAVVRRDGVDARLGTGLAEAQAGEPRARKVRVNGAPVSSADALLEYLRVLWLTPAMDGLFTGPAGERRRFLDRLVLTVDPGHGRRARDFERLLTQRNRLLETGDNAAWLDAVEAQLAGYAVALAFARAETVTLLSGWLHEQADDPSPFPVGAIDLVGDFERAIAGKSAAEAELWYRRVLADGRGADRAAGRTLSGPHRSDLDVVFAEKRMPAARSSTGEQKALLIGLVLSHAALVASVSGMTPILLLDEIAAHLDPDRRAALFARLATLGCQTFMTGTDAALFTDLPSSAAMLRVADNSVAPLAAGVPRLG